MKDDLGDLILKSFEPDSMPVAVKYVAYGPLSAVSILSLASPGVADKLFRSWHILVVELLKTKV